jgi:hypothetical protein
MKSQNRAWIMFAVLFFSWSTLPASPFKYFADMIRQWFGVVATHTMIALPWQPVLLYFSISVLLVVLLLAGRGRSRLYIAGICSLATLVHHLIHCIRTGRVYAVSPAIAIGLALALLFLIIRVKSPALWLSDAYVIALSVWLIRDGFLPPVLDRLGLAKSQPALFLELPSDPLIMQLDQVWHLPVVVWAALPLAMAVLPLIFWSKGRQKG